MFNAGDPVEVIADGRRGSVVGERIDGRPPDIVPVYFKDGIQPLVKDYKAEELRLLERPHEEGPYRLIPETWI